MINILSRYMSKYKTITFHICVCSSDASKSNKTPMPKDLANKPDTTIEKIKEVTKEDLKWRTSWHQREGDHYDFLRSFYTEESHTNILKWISSPIDLSPSAIKNWYKTRRKSINIALQQYIPERNQTLGNELAAAHFIVYRGGAVKFFGDNVWIKANELNQYNLPKKYEDNMFLQGIDCSNMELYYEGLVNLRDLKQVEWLSFNGCEDLDDWALDAVSNIFSHSLLYLDLRNMPNISYRGLLSISKFKELKILYVDDVFASDEFEMTCLSLQEFNPDLDIRVE